MKFRVLLLLAFCNAACAELPPVVGGGGSVTPKSVAAATKQPVSTVSYEMMKRLEQMQTEIQQLTGKVEEQAFQIEELKKQQKTMYTDFDDRLQSLENKSGAAPTSTEAPSEATPPMEPQSKEPEAAPAPDTPSSAEVPEAGVAESSSTVVPEGAKPVGPPTKAPLSEDEKQEYGKAYDDLRHGKTTEAIKQFNDFINNHPDSAYGSNAYYWLGEAHRVNQDNASARTAFNTVVVKFPASEKVPDALLKLGYIEKDEKNLVKAREVLSRIIKEYPSSKAAKLAEKKMPMVEKGEGEPR